MELAKIENNPIVLALQSQLILDMKKVEATKLFVDLLSKTYFEAGQVVQGYNVSEQSKFLQITANALYEEIKDSFKFLRVQEIQIAFKNGLRGEYGDYYGLNIKTYHQWIKGWQFDDKRKQAQLTIKQSKEVEYKPVMSESEAEYAWRQVMKQRFEKFKKTGILEIEFPVYVFEWFEKNGFIKLGKEEKLTIWNEAKERIIEQKKLVRLNPRDRNHLNEATATINRILTQQTTKSDEMAIKQIATTIAIKKYFESVSELKI